jgi:hypothetical protein
MAHEPIGLKPWSVTSDCIRSLFRLSLTNRSTIRTREGCMLEAMHQRKFGPWHALQQLVAGPAIERI